MKKLIKFVIYIILCIGIITLLYQIKPIRHVVKQTLRNFHITKKQLAQHAASLNKPTVKVKVLDNIEGMFPYDRYPMFGEILNEKYNIVEVYGDNENYDVLLVWGESFNGRALPNTDAIKIFYTSEVVWINTQKEVEIIQFNPNDYDLSMGFDYFDHPKYIRLPYYYASETHRVTSTLDRGKCNPNKQYFACFMVSNCGWNKFNDGAALRNRIFHKLSLYKRVESGGQYLNNTYGPIARSLTDYWFSQCKFAIYYENQTYPGYNTEKVVVGYANGAIPIYYSHPAGLSDINKKAMIYAGDFDSEDALVEYIKKVDNDDDLYCKIWNEKLINDSNKEYEVVKRQISARFYELIDNKLKQKSEKSK